MNTTDYEAACLRHLNNRTYYDEVEEDPNTDYREQFDDYIKQLRGDDLITEVE